MNVERMNLAIEILNDVIECKLPFDYSDLGTRGFSCGTRACAAGWIALDERTELRTGWNSVDELTIEYGTARGIPAVAEWLGIDRRTARGILAVAEWLGIDRRTAMRVFADADVYYKDICFFDVQAHHIRDLLVYYRDNGEVPEIVE